MKRGLRARSPKFCRVCTIAQQTFGSRCWRWRIWPAKARRAAEGLTGVAQSRSEIGSLLFDILFGFMSHKAEKLLSRNLVGWLNRFEDRPWMELPGLRCVDGGKR